MGTAAKLGLPTGYRFVPTDEELVADYLLPRILEQALPANDIQEVDPLSAQPSVLVDDRLKNGDSFFFAEGQPMNARGGRQKRTCVGGGTWEGQGKQKTKRADHQVDSAGNKKLLRAVAVQPGAAPAPLEEIVWEKRAFNFHEDPDRGSTGWVMHEYSITAPPRVAASRMRVYRVRFSGHGRIAQQKRKRDAQQQQHCVDDDDGEIVQADDEDDGPARPPPPRSAKTAATRYEAAMEEFEHAVAASTYAFVGGEVPAPAAEGTFAPQQEPIGGAAYYPPSSAPQTEATAVYYPAAVEGEGYAGGGSTATFVVGEDGRYYYTFVAPQQPPVEEDAAAMHHPLVEVEYPEACAPDQTQPDTAVTMFLGEDGRYYYYYTLAPQQQPPDDQSPISCFPAADAFNYGGDRSDDRDEVPALVDAVDGNNNLAGPTTVAAAAEEEEDAVDGNPAAGDGTTIVVGDDAGAGSSAVPSPRPWEQADLDELNTLIAATSPSHDELFSGDINVDVDSGHSA